MILKQIKDYIQKNKRTTFTELKSIFKESPEIIETSLNHLIQTGKIKKINIETDCKLCSKDCYSTALSPEIKIYEWIE